jgi:putative spermidine/putrescine transport system permease protein
MSYDLKRETARARWRHEATALALIAPLFLFLAVTFFAPIAVLLWQSVSDPAVGRILPQTVATLNGWDGRGLPPDAAYDALVSDLSGEESDEALAKAATRLNIDAPGMRSLMFKTAEGIVKAAAGDAKSQLIAIDARWGRSETWGAIAGAGGPLTDRNLLAAFDLQRNIQGQVVRVPADRAVFLRLTVRTFVMAFSVCAICLVIGFPLAYLLANCGERARNRLMFFVLVPLWVSILVRTLSWTVLLQREGILNDLLVRLDLIAAPLNLIFNRIAVYVGMVHILLPFMVLALFSVMKGIPEVYTRAAGSLGAPPVTVFRRIYLPLVKPGITSGCLLVFIQALGAYITPVLLGGPNDQGIATQIAFYVNKTTNWGFAAALSLVLLVATMLLFSLYGRLTGGKSLQVA